MWGWGQDVKRKIARASRFFFKRIIYLSGLVLSSLVLSWLVLFSRTGGIKKNNGKRD